MKNVIFIFLINIMSFSSGCGVLHSLVGKTTAYNLQHKNSCAPRAIQKAHWEVGEDVTRLKISQQIKSGNNLVRPIASIFVPQGRNITMPSEIRAYFKSNGFYIKKIKNFQDLKEGDVALILLKEKNTIYYHWVCYPVDYNITGYFGDRTIVKDIYIIKKTIKNL